MVNFLYETSIDRSPTPASNFRCRLKLRRLEEELTDRGVNIPPISDSASKSDREEEPEVSGGVGNVKSAAERFGPQKKLSSPDIGGPFYKVTFFGRCLGRWGEPWIFWVKQHHSPLGYCSLFSLSRLAQRPNLVFIISF